MLGLTRLHALAAGRGDGLRPELLELLSGQDAMRSGNVEDISRYLEHAPLQAGPHPTAALSQPLPANVIAFPPAADASSASSIFAGRR